MKQNEKDQSLVGYPPGRSGGDKRPCFRRGFVVSKMKDAQDNAGVFLRFSENEMCRLQRAARSTGAPVESWLLLAALDAVEKHERKHQANDEEDSI
jgi:hypothetical protein